MNELSILAKDNSSSTFFLPLRTNVQYFDSAEARLKLEERVKQASLLHDKLLFEGGVYTASAWEEHGGKVFDMWYPPESFDLDDIARDDEKFQPTGGEPYVKFDNYVFASGKAERQFRAQFHVLLHKMGADRLPWVDVQVFQAPSELDNDIKSLARDDHELVAAHISASSRLRDKIAYNLNRDLVLASQLQVAASIDDMFNPLVHGKAERDHAIQPALGFSTLEVAVPNWSSLQWEEVFELREHPSLVEFRKKMVTIERMAKEAVAQNAHRDLRYEISQIITDEVSDELHSLRQTPQGVVRDVVMDLLTSPLTGISTLITAIRGDLQLQAQENSWTTAFFKLRKPESS
jgi:hypothetical protein